MKPNLQRTFIPTVKPFFLSNPSNLRPTLSISSPQWLKNKLRRRNFPSSKKPLVSFSQNRFSEKPKTSSKNFSENPKKKEKKIKILQKEKP